MSQSLSYWSSENKLLELPTLTEFPQADVIIIGAGISGLTSAYLLLKAGKSVIILDDGPVAGGETCRTTAHLSNMLDDRFVEIERLFGTESLRNAIKSHTKAIDLIEKIVLEENISCDFERVDGYLFQSPEDPPNTLKKELDAARRAGIKEAKLVPSPISTFESKEAFHMPLQAQFHPLKYIKGLLQAVLRLGGSAYHAHVVGIKGGDLCEIVTQEKQKLYARALIIATNTPINNRFIMHTKQAAYRTYVIAATIPKGSVPLGLYYDTLDPYHYVRVVSKETEDVLILGGEDHKTGQDAFPLEKYEKLEKWGRKYFPMMGDVMSRWSGQIMEPIDSLAFLGPNPLEKNVYIITGDSGNGLTHGTLGAMINSGWILGKESPYAALYHPARKNLKATLDFVKENGNVGCQYADWVKSLPSFNSEQLPKEAGNIFSHHGEKIAVYKDQEGVCHAFSAVCPHLGCLVKWNDAEKSWDCPCHGSRFDCSGEVLNGPAVSPLSKKHV